MAEHKPERVLTSFDQDAAEKDKKFHRKFIYNVQPSSYNALFSVEGEAAKALEALPSWKAIEISRKLLEQVEQSFGGRIRVRPFIFHSPFLIFLFNLLIFHDLLIFHEK